jgi:hypothetical protein
MAADADAWSAIGPDEAEVAERASRRQDFFASHGLLSPRSPVGEPMDSLAAEPATDCVLLGPSRSGKTALLAAFGWAAAPECADGPVPFPLGPLAKLVTAAERRSVGGLEWAATTVTSAYAVQLHMATSAVLLMTLDSPGGQLFPFAEESWAALTPASRRDFQSRTLVVCVDAVEPQAGLWRESLPQLLACLAQATGRFASRPSPSRPRRAIDFPRLLVPEKRLGYERILVAVTRVDPLVGAARGLIMDAAGSGRCRLRIMPSRTEIALGLDPVLLLGELVPGLLDLLQTALDPGAQLAVGLTSAWGLDSAARHWRPFGVEACLRFLIAGECKMPVVAVERRRLSQVATGGWIELPAAGGNEQPFGGGAR